LDGDVPATFFLVTVENVSTFESDGCELGTLIGPRSTRTTHDENEASADLEGRRRFSKD